MRELYQELLLDHNRSPRNFGRIEGATHTAEGYNPLCGDRIELWVDVKDGRIENLRFEGAGCAISTASASVMTEAVKGKTLHEAAALFAAMIKLVTGNEPEGVADAEPVDLGSLEAFSGLQDYPMRVKCATLAWHTLRAALARTAEPVVTE